MKTICCECKTVIQEDMEKDGQISHGLCQQCYQIKMNYIESLKITQNIKRE
jgi:hypothetical protein